MKKLLFVLFLVLVSVSTAQAQGEIKTPENDPYFCHPDLVKQWLIFHREYMNAINDVWNASASGLFDPIKGSILIQQNTFALFENIPRPTCADEAMNAAFYTAMTYSEYLVCLSKNYGCTSEVFSRIEESISVEEGIYKPLYTIASMDLFDPTLTSIRPLGWEEKWNNLLQDRSISQTAM